MERIATLLASRGRTDERDRLLSADEPLADLHSRCGGSIPGTLAVPELLEAVKQARAMGLRIAREFAAFDGEERVTGFVRVHPIAAADGGGCELLIENWQTAEPREESDANIGDRLESIDRSTAEITLRLDREQNVQLIAAASEDADELQAEIGRDPGQKWTHYLDLIGVDYQQPLHWRLLDGVGCRVPGSKRQWKVRILPLGPSIESPRGFELLLNADQPLDRDSAESREDDDKAMSHTRLIGNTLTPALRQPVARIIANAETVRAKLAGPLRTEYSEYAGTIASAGQHLTSMLEDLADLEVVESPEFKTAREPVDLADAARRAGGILGVRAQARSITLEFPDQEEPRIANAEFRRVLQILINLIGNAIAYSPSNSVVRLEYTDAPRGMVALEIGDEGPGVDPDQARRIFEKFERLGREDTAGSGLGLYISRRLALAMDGDLQVDTKIGSGARFTLTLPAYEAKPKSSKTSLRTKSRKTSDTNSN